MAARRKSRPKTRPDNSATVQSTGGAGKDSRRRTQTIDPFAALTWDDLEAWAGDTIVERGRTYQRRGAVRDLARTADGGLLAWVSGTERYATRVTLQAGSLTSACTCPYWAACKHAVAVVLQYLDQVKSGVPVPQAAGDDLRLTLLDRLGQHDPEELDEDDGSEDAEDWGEDEDADEDEEGEGEATAPRSRRRAERGESGLSGRASTPTAGRRSKRTASLGEYLREQTHAELVSLLEEIARDYAEVRRQLEDRQTLTSGRTAKMLRAARSELAALAQVDWQDGYGGHGADLDRLQTHLEALVKAGQADAVVRLGPELLEAGTRAVEAEDEGESSDPLRECLGVVFGALPRSGLTPVQQLAWAVDMAQADQHDLCEDGLAAFWETEFEPSVWSGLADQLAAQLEGLPAKVGREDYTSHHGRDRLSGWLIGALEQAGRGNEVLPLCEREAPITCSYQRLVERLMAARRWEEAERWCVRGIEATQSSLRGVAASLRAHLGVVSGKTGNPLRAVALLADDFFARPSWGTFQNLLQAARKAGVAEGVEVWARHYLETGRRPAVAGCPAGTRAKGDPPVAWPLPATGVPPETRRGQAEAPMVEALTEIAIAEKRPDEVIRWYDHAASRQRPGVYYHGSDERVAEAVQEAYPDRAIEIWKRIAEAYIAHTQVQSYRAAGPYLRQVRDLLVKKGRQGEWEAYVGELRVQNRRKPRCVEVLDRLASPSRRIVE
ncbi:MAG: SWIM zinc finger family protein [Candidatus Latescibacterota bacterium]